MQFNPLSRKLTFDLHYSNEVKAQHFRLWVRRIYSVASILKMSYSELWELPEQEFLLLEELAFEIQRKSEQDKNELKEMLNNGGHR